MPSLRLALAFALFGALPLAACDSGAPAAPHYFERVIEPILTASCARAGNQGGCHQDDGHGNALGNLDVTSYEAITRRRDVLRTYGSFPVPLLLIKGSGMTVPPIPYQAPGKPMEFHNSEIDHAGGAILSPDSNAYFELLQWMSNGATEDGRIATPPQTMGTGACRSDFATVRPDVAAQLALVDASSPAFQSFVSSVEPIITKNCALGTCHSSEQSDFFITCQGAGDDASKFNFLEAQAFLGTPVDQSLFLLKPLSPGAGGIAHTGGVFFQDKSNADWKALSDWAAQAGVSALLANASAGQKFFNDNVMPVFLKRGCAFEACHSPGAANDFKLRAGTRGFFSAFSLDINYRFARHDFLTAELPDVRQSRLIKKPIVPYTAGGLGLVHRGGPPLQSGGEVIDPTACPQPWTAASSPFCTIVEWHRLERQQLLTDGKVDALAAGDTLGVVVVERPPDADKLIEFDTYRPGARLLLAHLGVGMLGAVDPTNVSVEDLLAGCGALGAPASFDIRHPDVSFDGSRVAFALRTSAADTLDIYEVTLDSAHTCTKITNGNGQSANGILLHNLDPMYGPDGSLVFASTRGRPNIGPTRSLKYLLPQTDLWRLQKTVAGYGPPEQLTALLGSELGPAMMLDGRLSFSAEKATSSFYQVSGRRMNWDITDYHPLLAQRAQSVGYDPLANDPMAAMNTHPSVGYSQATEIREAWDRNFLVIFSDDGARGGGGTLVTFNRSIGPFEADRGDVNFLHSVTFLDPAATGRAGATVGAYRSPAGLPDGRVLVSYAPAVTDLTATTPQRYDLTVMNPVNGTRIAVAGLSGGAKSYVQGVVAIKREQRTPFKNLTQLVFGGNSTDPDKTTGSAHYPDLPMLGTLLGANLRTGRFVDAVRAASKLVVYEHQAPPMGTTAGGSVYDVKNLLGSAALEADGSVHVRVPALTPLIYELQDPKGNVVFTMSEEDQLGPGEHISRGVPEKFFNSVCGGCHGSVGGKEVDVAINPDALTGASVSLARDKETRIVP